MTQRTVPLTAAIPTFGRDQVLVDTVRFLLALEPAPAEILVLDQTVQHEEGTARFLREHDARGALRWLRIEAPSIPHAMNEGLLAAREDIVLFLDDDIRPDAALAAAHDAAHRAQPGVLAAGRVLQPWDEGRDASADSHFHFACDRPQAIAEFMGGNFSLDRRQALALGGFDENFVRVAYRFEAEFALRWRAAGHRIQFVPAASLHHLKAASGGTRSYGDHLTTWRPDHAVGAYYYALRSGEAAAFLRRPARSVATRFHLRRPWRIPVTLAAEVAGMAWALALFVRGARLVRPAALKGAA